MLLMACSVFAFGQDKEVFIKHSSGLIAGKKSDSRGAIFSSTASEAVKLKLRDTGDGYFLIVHTDKSGNETFLTLNGSWNTFFETDPNTDNAKYKVDGDAESLFVLRNKANGRCLGTDGTNNGDNIYSDKGGDAPNHFWYFADTKSAPIPTSNSNYIVCPTDRLQTNEGWGVSLCWWASMCGNWSDANINKLVDWLVSPTGLNYNIFRYNIGGGDDPENRNCDPHHMDKGKGHRAEMEGFKLASGDDYDWSRDAAQRKIMLKIREKRPDAIFEAFSNTPPYYMTYSGCCSGNKDGGKDNLKPEYYEEFAHYLVDVCKHYKDEYGIEFKTLEPFNEATTSYWYQNGGQEGCHFDNQSQINFLKVLYPILKASGLNTVISASDETSVGGSIGTYNAYAKAGILDLVDQWNTHTYSASNANRANLGSLVRNGGKTLWMSETGAGGNGIGGNLSMAQRMFDDIRFMHPSAWVDWQYVEENNDQWCLVRGSFANQTYNRVKNYYVRQQVTRNIKQGYSFLPSLSPQSLAAVNEAGDTLVLVILNTGATSALHNAHIAGCKPDGAITAYQTSESKDYARLRTGFSIEGNTFKFEAPSQSITTFIIPIKSTKIEEQSAVVEEDIPYLILPQYTQAVALTGKGNSVTIEGLDLLSDTLMIDASQMWYFKPFDNGDYGIKNANGDIITGSSSYALATSKLSSDNQKFTLEKIDSIYCKITCSANGKSFDLSNERTTAGTTVGLWDYGTDVTRGHRNWFLLPLRPYVEKENPLPDAILNTSDGTSSTPSVHYSLAGIKQSNPTGICIVKYADGTTKKMLLK